MLKGKDAFGREGHLAIVRAPRSLPRIIQLPEDVSGGQHDFVFLSAVLSAFVDELFPGMQVKGAYQFRVTRNSELIVDEEEVENLALRAARRTGRPRLPARGAAGDRRAVPEADRAHAAARTSSCRRTRSTASTARSTSTASIQVYDLVQRPDLKFPPFQPRALRRHRRAMFDTVARARRAAAPSRSIRSRRCSSCSRQAAEDPNVLAIKQTLYRTGKDSPIVEHLVAGRAQRQGRHRGGRAARALRRGSQPRPRRPPAGSRRAGRVRRGRLQDPRQDAADRAPRGPQAAPLRAPGHRQLPHAAPRAPTPTSA